MLNFQRIIIAIVGVGLFGGLLSFTGIGLPKESSTLSVRLESVVLGDRTHQNTTRNFGK